MHHFRGKPEVNRLRVEFLARKTERSFSTAFQLLVVVPQSRSVCKDQRFTEINDLQSSIASPKSGVPVKSVVFKVNLLPLHGENQFVEFLCLAIVAMVNYQRLLINNELIINTTMIQEKFNLQRNSQTAQLLWVGLLESRFELTQELKPYKLVTI